MKEAVVLEEVKIEEKPGSRRRLINKVRRKVKRENEKMAQIYTDVTK